MASVHKQPNGKWRVKWRAPDGRQRSRTFDLQRDAKAFGQEIEIEQRSGRPDRRELAEMTIDEWYQDWLSTVVHIKATTRNGYESSYRNHVGPRIGHTAVRDFDRLAARKYVADLSADETAHTVQRAVAVLRSVLQLAVDGGAITGNPCLRMRLPRGTTREMHFLDPGQIADLVEAVGERRGSRARTQGEGHDPWGYGLLVRTAAYTGMRAGELSALRGANIDRKRKRIHVVESASEPNGVWTVTDTKTHRRRFVPLFDELLELLLEHMSKNDDPDGYVFHGEKGGPLRHKNWYDRTFVPAVRSTPSVPDGVRYHDLRHSCVAMLIERGAHPRAIMEWMGHSTITVCMDRYGHLFPAINEELAAGLGELMFHERSMGTSSPSTGELSTGL